MRHFGFLILVIGFMALAGWMFWSYDDDIHEAGYTQTFEKTYAAGKTSFGPSSAEDDPVYNGTRESHIKKYQGDRYATY